MKPIDVIEQLVGENTGWDIIDTMSFNFYGCTKYNGRTVVVGFDTGTLDVYNEAGDDIDKTYAIKATLEEIPND